MLFPRLRPMLFFDGDDGGGSGGGGDGGGDDGENADAGGGKKPEAKVEDWKAKYEEATKERDEYRSRMTDADVQLRGAAKDAKLHKEIKEAREKGDTKRVLELLEIDPLLVAADAFPALMKPKDEPEEDEPPPKWAQDIQKKLTESEKREEQRSKREAENARLGSAYNFLSQEGLAEKYPHLAVQGNGAAVIMAQRIHAAEEEDGIRPSPEQIAKKMDQELNSYEDLTISMWAKAPHAAEKMVKALREAKVLGSSPTMFTSLTNKDQGGTGDKVDTSKMSDAERLKFNLEQAKARVARREREIEGA